MAMPFGVGARSSPCWWLPATTATAAQVRSMPQERQQLSQLVSGLALFVSRCFAAVLLSFCVTGLFSLKLSINQ